MKNKGLIIGGAIIVAILVLLGGSYISAVNTGANHEVGIEAQYKSNQNQYSNFTQSAVENLGVADRYKEGFKEILIGGLEGRYGEDGAQGTLLAIQEAYPGAFDDKLYANVQRVIESGRTNFKAEQDQLIQKVAAYERDLRFFWSGFWLRTAGYPSVDLAQYKPVISGKTAETFNTGIDQGIQF